MTDRLRLYFLGTGAAVPTPSRRAPALAIQRENEVILCDCGEGFQVRLQQTGLSASQVHTILISHLHGDHLFGLPGFLTSQQMFRRTAPLTLYGPQGLQSFLDCIAAVAKYPVEFPFQIIELTEAESSFTVGAFQVTARPLLHSVVCFGYRLQEMEKAGKFDRAAAERLGVPESPERSLLKRGLPVIVGGRIIRPEQVLGPAAPGRILTYCTDTVPCEAGKELARNCDVLIHDATFSDAFADRAEPTLHSTSRQAAQLAREAGANRLFLWHLSMRVHGAEEQALLEQARQEFPESYLPNDLEWFDVPRRGEA